MGSKLIYNLKGIGRMLLPRTLTQAQLHASIRDIFRLDSATLESIAARVAHYHKINHSFSISAESNDDTRRDRLSLAPPHYGILRDNKLSDKHSSVYFYDSYEWTRYFPDSFAWNYEFGDVNYYLTNPAITKTRPIDSRLNTTLTAPPLTESSIRATRDSAAPDSNATQCSTDSTSLESTLESNALESTLDSSTPTNHNNILLQLEKNRHFSFVKDTIPYENKRDMLFFRGACPQEHRSRFLHTYFSHPLCDLGHTGGANEHPHYVKPKISKQEHLQYKFLLSLEGNDVASNLKWVLGSNSLCIMPKPRYESWFMEERLQANVHYALLSDDYSNLDEVLEFFLSHPQDAKDIIHNAHAYCAQFRNYHIERACNLLVLRKYFYLSNQGDLSPDERTLLEV